MKPNDDDLCAVSALGCDLTIHLPLKDVDHIQRYIFESGRFYEYKMLFDIAQRFFGGSGVAIDVGANIGNHTLFFAGVLGLDVWCFEPCVQSFDILISNLKINDLLERVVAKNVACHSSPGLCSIANYSKENTGSATIDLSSGDIPVVCLDDYIDEITSSVRLIKVDVEGCELEVLRGAVAVIRRDRPAIYVEAASEKAFIEVYALLRDEGYVCLGRFNATATYSFSYAEEDKFLVDLANIQQHGMNQFISDNRNQFRQFFNKVSADHSDRLGKLSASLLEESSVTASANRLQFERLSSELLLGDRMLSSSMKELADCVRILADADAKRERDYNELVASCASLEREKLAREKQCSDLQLELDMLVSEIDRIFTTVVEFLTGDDGYECVSESPVDLLRWLEEKLYFLGDVLKSRDSEIDSLRERCARLKKQT